MKTAAAVIAALLACGGCGYHVGGHADLLPKKIHTIAIPAFSNVTTRYKLAEQLPAAIAHEFIERTRYNVVADPNEADAVLTGAVVNFMAYPTTNDPISGRSTAVQAIVTLQIALTERNGPILFNRPAMEFRERYEISIDPQAYFDESGAAMQRLSRDVARSVVTAILENF